MSAGEGTLPFSILAAIAATVMVVALWTFYRAIPTVVTVGLHESGIRRKLGDRQWTYQYGAGAAGDGPVPAARCGVIRTKAVDTRTSLLLLRWRYHIITTRGDEVSPLLAEDTQLVGFRSAPSMAEWLTREDSESILLAEPDDYVTGDVARNFIQKVIDEFDHLRPRLDEIAESHSKELLDAHQRVRTAARRTGVRYSIEPQLPPDVLGLYVYLPVMNGGS